MHGARAEPPDEGVLFVISGPSGVGKSTLVRRLLDAANAGRVPPLGFSVSATTRGPREGEVDGQHYHFLTPARFAALVDEGAFLEHAEVYGRCYGTLAEPTRHELAGGRSLLLDIDVRGAEQVRASLPEAVHVFLLPPDMATLEQRLRDRATDSEAVILRRIAEAGEQLRGATEFDYLVFNDDLDQAAANLIAIVLAEMSRRARRQRRLARLLDELPAG